ncbi:MAG: thioredoxin domain-containing protein [Anaerolineae bacterium]|nr:MAG: thioredoxin domain-containing protein [Anaerolineae bacterium]
MPNRLARETSPYLLQHAHNPVDWYPWGEEALAKARAEDKPIFLSIGYAACHWCHVMERESFEDPLTAELMNRHFVNIKVDREERPDLDSIYMAATVAMTGSGGWPMSVFLTPDLQPFYCGTYFPPRPRYNMPSFRDVLTGIANAWQNDRQEIFKVGGQVTEHLQRTNLLVSKAALPLTPALLDNAAEHLHQSYDWGFGGWGGAPKFPQPMTIEFLLARATHGAEPEKRANFLKTAIHALQAMARGGMYDVVGGGFARYSVDALWRVPHFEKMLYDNAQLALAYLHGYLLTGEVKFRQVCQETLDFVLREMRHPLGGFYSSLDADSEGEEGKFYVWQFHELQDVLGAEFDFFKTAYGLTPAGNWEGKIVLQRALDDATLAARFAISPAAVSERLSRLHARLLEVRSRRVRPATDDKVLTAWNALMLQAFAEAARYLRRTDYLQAAQHNARFLLENLQVDGKLLRSWRDGTARHTAYLEDYAAFGLALLALYQSDPDPTWYTAALRLADDMLHRFADPSGGFFDTPADHEPLLMRPKDTQDNATPSGNALAAHLLLQLSAYGDRPEWRHTAEEMLAPVLETAVRYPTAFAKWLTAADFALGPVNEVALVGDNLTEMLDVLWKTFRPRQVAAIAAFPPPLGSPALLRDRPVLQCQPTAYVCRNFVCKQPCISPTEFAAQLMPGEP